MTSPYLPGSQSSEFKKALRVELAGFALIAVGLLVAVAAAILSGIVGIAGEAVTAAVGVGLVASGAYMVTHGLVGYAHSRGQVKAAAVTKPTKLIARGL